MENVNQEQEHNIHEFFKKLIFERDQKIQTLENELKNGTRIRTIIDPIFEQKHAEAEVEIRSLRRQLAASKAENAAIVVAPNDSVSQLEETQKALLLAQNDLKIAESNIKSLQNNFSDTVEIEQRENQILRQKLIQLSAQPLATPDNSLDQAKMKSLQSELDQLKKESNTQINNYKDNQNSLNETIMRMRNDYQSLRKQKGGFGFTSIIMGLVVGGLLGFGIHWMFFAKKDEQAVVFQKFKNENLFNMEYDISQGRLENVENNLKTKADSKEFKSIASEIEFIKKIVGAAKRKMSDGKPLVAASNSEVNGFALDPKVEEAKIQEKAKKTLTINDNAQLEVTIRSEASTGGEKLGKMKKGETAGVWDRTNGLDKITTSKDGNKYEVQDYWYKIETTDGIEGWVFGYFTNRSLQRMTLISAPAAATPATETPAANISVIPGAKPGPGIPSAPTVKIAAPEVPPADKGNN
jgi:Bacterial SH3 domain